jgi:hypothetical protein
MRRGSTVTVGLGRLTGGFGVAACNHASTRFTAANDLGLGIWNMEEPLDLARDFGL